MQYNLQWARTNHPKQCFSVHMTHNFACVRFFPAVSHKQIGACSTGWHAEKVMQSLESGVPERRCIENMKEQDGKLPTYWYVSLCTQQNQNAEVFCEKQSLSTLAANMTFIQTGVVHKYFKSLTHWLKSIKHSKELQELF